MTQPNEQLKDSAERLLASIKESDREERLVRIRHFWGNSDFEIRKGEALAKYSIIEEAKSDINFLLEENKRLTQEIESHGPEGRNYTNEQYVALRLELEQVKAERDEHKQDAETISKTHMATIDHARALEIELAAKDEVLRAISESVVHGGSWYRYKARDVLKQYPPREKGADNERD